MNLIWMGDKLKTHVNVNEIGLLLETHMMFMQVRVQL